LRKISLICILLILILNAQSVLATATERYLEVSHRSEILGKKKKIAIILPADYTPKKRYPVLYLLHGAGGNYLTWHKEDAKLYELSREYEMIIVTPDLETSWLADSPIKPKSQYESYIIKELIPLIDAEYSTIPTYRGRGIAGLSMGGHGAMVLVSKYPDIFGVASSMSGVLDIRMISETAGKKSIFGDPLDYPEVWNNNSAVYLAENLKKARRRPRIMFDIGLKDYVYETNLKYHTTLKKLGIDHTFKVYPGSHDWGYWVARLPEHLEFQAKNLKKPEICSEE